jgi:hypothetical protein
MSQVRILPKVGDKVTGLKYPNYLKEGIIQQYILGSRPKFKILWTETGDETQEYTTHFLTVVESDNEEDNAEQMDGYNSFEDEHESNEGSDNDDNASAATGDESEEEGNEGDDENDHDNDHEMYVYNHLY